jgi:hypothetical protein
MVRCRGKAIEYAAAFLRWDVVGGFVFVCALLPDYGHGPVAIWKRGSICYRHQNGTVSTLSTMGRVAITFPLFASITASALLRQPMNKREEQRNIHGSGWNSAGP